MKHFVLDFSPIPHAVFADLRYAIRGLGRAPLCAATAILSLAVGIAASTAIFSLADAMLIRPRDPMRALRNE
jgi:hypothetical protein